MKIVVSTGGSVFGTKASDIQLLEQVAGDLLAIYSIDH
jgi:hypothetical protein